MRPYDWVRQILDRAGPSGVARRALLDMLVGEHAAVDHAAAAALVAELLAAGHAVASGGSRGGRLYDPAAVPGLTDPAVPLPYFQNER